MSSWIKLLSIQTLVFLGALVCADVFLWLFRPLNLNSDELTFSQTLPGVKSEVKYTRNSFGFRSLSMKGQHKDHETIRVLCLGASTTDQALQDDKDIWCSILQQAANAKPLGVTVETAAFGRGGWRAKHLFKWARDNALKFQPDIVLILMGVNDLSWNGGPEYAYEGIDKLMDSKAPEEQTKSHNRTKINLKEFCKEISQLCRRATLAKRRLLESNSVLEWHSANLPDLRKTYSGYPFVLKPARPVDPIHEFTDAMGALVDFFERNGVGVIVLGQPVLWKAGMTNEEQSVLWFPLNTSKGYVRPPPGWLESEMNRYNQAQEAIAKSRKATYINLDGRVPKTLHHFVDDCHFTDLGNVIVAENVLPALQRELLMLIHERKASK